MGKILTVCSGSGGVGKSTIALSAAVGAAKRGMRTILLDASGASRSCDLMLGLESVIVIDMLDVVKLQASIQAALYAVPGRANLQFACAALYEGVGISELSGILLALRAMSDVLVIDLPTGPFRIGDGVLDESDGILMITRPDDTSIRALERLTSTMPRSDAQRHLIVNRINRAWVKKKIQYDVPTVEMLLDLPASGIISENESIPLGAKKGKPAIECDMHVRMELEKLLKALL